MDIKELFNNQISWFEYNIFKGWEYKAKKSVDVDFFLNFIKRIF